MERERKNGYDVPYLGVCCSEQIKGLLVRRA